MKTCPLVSVVVATYNSEKTVIQTLDSIMRQSYSNIELIITDDCSKDKTVSLCNEWIERSLNRFTKAVVVTSDFNTGVPSNFNRGISVSSGEWIKTIAGDDIIEDQAIEKYLDYISHNSAIKVLFARSQTFMEGSDGKKIFSEIFPHNDQLDFYNKNAEEQSLYLIQYNNVPATTSFIKRDLLLSYPFDEDYKYMEDYPYWVKITRLGYKLYFLDDIAVYYRKGAESLTSSRKRLYNTRFMECSRLFYMKERRELLYKVNYPLFVDRERYYYVYDFARLFLKNKNTWLNVFILKIVKYMAKINIKNIQL